ncbi:hypothetical protein [Pseudanabaena sp. FACHB-2040]|uniref:hypothetical protein n=1 Tax=Pseudanabaena sp. FACHB-2040 TaxID=2692859 RepID=UPI0016822073|nr:hypothetical protein [Pseudanabaena sp. FACHB-2040]MBD2260623.1 hypothetical protein [Pseudanabaena sp. FACHB-2040]
MKRTIGIVSAVSISLLLAIGVLAHERRSRSDKDLDFPAVQAVATPADLQSPGAKLLPFQAYDLMSAVAQPLLSFPIMKRAVAVTASSTSETPLSKLLTSQLTTVGLGQIRIGMTVEEVAQAGIQLVPLDGNARGECQYLRVPKSLESVGFMVVDDQIIRVDVWPGSSIETKSGIKIGATEADILEYYEGRIEMAPNPETGGKYLVFTPSGEGEDLYRLVFETDPEERVVAFRSGQFPAVIWPEGCL